MFHSQSWLLKKTGPDGVGRYEFLRQLITEFNTTKSLEAKKQTLANLANFGYDPINYTYFSQLHVVDIFLGQLSEDQEELVKFALAGLCNVSTGTASDFREYIISLNGVFLISTWLLHKNEEISLHAITTLYYLLSNGNEHLITPEIAKKAEIYASSTNPRLARKYCMVASQLPQLQIGQKYQIKREITPQDLQDFIKLSGDSNPIHTSNCQQRAIVHGAFLNALVSGVIGTKLPGPGSVVIKQTLNFPNKCFVNDIVEITVELVEIRKIITVKFRCCNNEGKVVMEGDAKLIFNKQ